ncbi:MAG: hypothetical protein GF368_00875 [Candidatus Aenigmarchaeota archaeon]|nr:hypothetical protein [Candidatus Aenigmarchaeota archaeon]
MVGNYKLGIKFQPRSGGLGIWWELEGTGRSGYLPVENPPEKNVYYVEEFLEPFLDRLNPPVPAPEIPVHFDLSRVSTRCAQTLRHSIGASYGNDPDVTVSE